MGFTEAEDAAFWPIYREYDSEMAKLGDERVALIAEYAASTTTPDRRGRRQARRQGDRAGGAAAGGQGEVLRARQGGAVAAHGPALPAGRASAAAADRPADCRRRFRSPSNGRSNDETNADTSMGLPSVLVAGDRRVAVGRPGPAAIGQGRRGHVHRRRQQDRAGAARQRQRLRDAARTRRWRSSSRRASRRRRRRQPAAPAAPAGRAAPSPRRSR